MKSTSRQAILVAALAVLAIGCSGCGGNGADGDADTDADAAGESDPVGDPACETDYPAGPYGTTAGDVIENLAFPSVDGGTYSLHHAFCDSSVKLLLVYATAGWCTACQVESSDLPGVYSEFHDQGLEILAVVFENTSGDPATVPYATGYRDHYAFPFPTVADPDLQITDYFDKTQAPLNMFVNLRTMEIIALGTGYTAGGLRSDIETHLAAIEDRM